MSTVFAQLFLLWGILIGTGGTCHCSCSVREFCHSICISFHFISFVIPTTAGRSIHVMTFDVGAVLEDEKWQAPVYCFENKETQSDLGSKYNVNVGYLEPQLKEILGGSMQL